MVKYVIFDIYHCSVVDVGTEWRTFSNEKSTGNKDPSRVGAAEVMKQIYMYLEEGHMMIFIQLQKLL